MMGDNDYPAREFARDVAWGLLGGTIGILVVLGLFVGSRAFWWALVNMWRAFY